MNTDLPLVAHNNQMVLFPIQATQLMPMLMRLLEFALAIYPNANVTQIILPTTLLRLCN